MLTDYHVHLRVDDPSSTPAAAAFTQANAERYREAAAERGIEELGDCGCSRKSLARTSRQRSQAAPGSVAARTSP